MKKLQSQDFVHLHVRSPFSFYEGAGKLKELMETAVRLGQAAIAVTDRNRTSGIVPAFKTARELGIKVIPGLLLDDPRDASRTLLLWARNLAGYGELCRQATERQLNPQFALETAAESIKDSVIAATSDVSLLQILQERLPPGSVYGELTLPEGEQSRYRMRNLYDFCRKIHLPLVVTGQVAYAEPSQRNLADLLFSVGQRQVLRRASNFKRPVVVRPLDDGGELLTAFRALPKALLNSRLIADLCNVDLHLGELKFPQPKLSEGTNPFYELRQRTEQGLRKRYGDNPTLEARERLAYELGVIDHLGFTGYILVVHDIAREAWSRGIRTLGRGSAANSIACYCLGLTDICPLRYNLYFERFLNPERTSPPDVDLDFSWRDRDEVLRHVYKVYGDDHVAMIATTITFRARAALHEAALSHGIPEDEITKITKRIPYFSHAKTIASLCEESPECAELPLNREPWLTISKDADQLLGFPRHLSIHVGGIIISPDPITNWTALEMSAKGFVITQYDMYSIEDLGLVKIDLLSQRALGVLKDTVNTVEENTGQRPPVDDILRLFHDKPTWNNIRSGKTMGCFYVESPGMQALLKKLGCDNYELLVAASSVIRPGVSESGMMQQYIERVRDPSKAEYLHPKMRSILAETHGVMIYQEDVIKVAHHIAGISLGRADTLRRAMSGKSRSRGEMAKMEEEFLQGCQKNGVQLSVAQEIWRQIASFAGYAFCKAHSASFAVLSVQIAYLRTHHPAEFMAAVLANGGGYFSQAAYIEEAKRMGLKVLLPDVNNSRLEHYGYDKYIRIGLKGIGVLREDTPQRIIENREQEGLYHDLGDLIRRVNPSRDEVEALIQCGALDGFSSNRPTLLRRLKAGYNKLKESPGPLAAGVEDIFAQLPEAPDWSEMEKWTAEKTILGFSPGRHPLALLDLPTDGAVSACMMERFIGRRVKMIGWAFSHKSISTRTTKETMKFVSMEDLTGTFEVTVFPRIYQQYAPRLHGNGPFAVTGRVEDEQGVCTLIAERIENLAESAGR